MPRFTTVVAVISDDARELVSAVDENAANTTAVRLADFEGAEDADQRRIAWSEATRRRNVYTLIDFDPLTPLVEAWVARLQGRTDALDAAPALVEPDSLAEYFLIADDVEGDVLHWYHGLLRGFAPRRVVAIRPNPTSIMEALAHLKAAPAFPSADAIARTALEYVPTGLSTGEETPPAILLER